MEDTKEVQDTSDYKLDKRGRKIKSHRLVFNKGEDDGKKGVSEQMKKTFSTFVEQHTPELTEEQLNELVAEIQEVLGKDQPAGKWISDFVHSDNPKFAGKSKEKRKQMALAAYYSSQRNEELKGGQVKLDKNKNGKIDAQDFKLLRKEESEQIDEAIHADDYIATSEKSKMGDGHRPHVVNKSTGKTMHLSQYSYKSAEHAKQHAQAYLTGYAKMGPNAADRHAHEFYKANKDKLVKESADMLEHLWPGTPEYKKKFDTDRVTGAGARHDIKKTATGVIATRRFSDNDTAEKPKDAPKRGRGRPKKDKFAEAVEFLMSLDETTFDSFMEEGFDTFMESFENLDEVSKTTLGSYIKKASRDAVVTRKIGADFEHQANKARNPGMKAASTSLADKWKSKSWKRSHNIDKAVDRLSK